MRCDGAHLGDDVLPPVVDHVVGAGAGGEVRLRGAADGRDDGGVGPPGELDGGVAHSAGTTGDQHRATLQRPGAEPGGTVLGHGQAPVRGQEGHAEAGAEVEGRDVGQQHHVPGRDDGMLLRGTAGRPAVGRLPDPDPQAVQGRFDTGADGVDHPGPVLVRHLWRVHDGTGLVAAARLPVRRVHAGAVDADPDLARPGVGQRSVDEGEDVRVTGQRVLDRAHVVDGSSTEPSGTSRGPSREDQVRACG